MKVKLHAIADFEEALSSLEDMVAQHCYFKDGVVDSGYLSSNAEAIRFLCKQGRMELIRNGIGRDVAAKWKTI